MEKRVLGRTGLWVSTLGVGTGQFGAFGQTKEEDCVRIAHAAFDGGITLVDTADFYSFGESEVITGKAIAGRRDKLVVATKCGMPLSHDPNERGGSRRWIFASVEGSLKRLNTDYIDLYQLHAPDPVTSIDETIEAMNDLVKAGKIRYFGTSNFSGLQVTEAALRARLTHQVAPHSEQSAYSIFNRQPEAELLPACDQYGVGFLAYSPLDGGWLSGKYRRDKAVVPTSRHRLQPAKFDLGSPANQAKLDAAEALAALADEAGIEFSHLAIGFVLAHKAVTAALVGGNSVTHVEKHLEGQDVRLSDEILDRIDAIVAPGANLPAYEQRSPALSDKTLRRRPLAVKKDEAGGVNFIRRVVTDEAKT